MKPEASAVASVTDAAAPDLVLHPRAIWLLFSAGWVCYGGLYLLAALTQGEGLGRALLGAAISVLAPAIPSIVIVLRRKELLEGVGTWRAFVGRRAAEGIVFTATSSGLASGLFWVCSIQPSSELGNNPWMLAVAWALNGIFLYTILVGFLMWTDSLERVQLTRAIVAREAVLRAEAESKALRAQFNPHFVFNTLHSLMLLVRAEPETAERAIDDVAELIRYASTLQRREIDQVPLAKELAFARRYVALERLRLADRLRLSWDVEDGLDDVLVPAFALQTLLENAIKHGVAPLPEGGAVVIRASNPGDDLVLEVADDGAGADPALVEADGGSGLRLLARRLATVYRGRARLTWRTAVGEGFSAVVTLPMRRVDAGAGGV